MSYDNNMKGQIWGNDKKGNDRAPDFKGTAEIEGVEYEVAAWKRDPNGNPKAPALRFQFEDKAKRQAAWKAQQGEQPAKGGDDFDTDIPF